MDRKLLDSIPSASGVALVRDSIYIIGDNAPWLFHVDKNFKLISRIPVLSGDFSSDTIIPKPEKPDFETLERINVNGTDYLFMFGSGSKSPQRDVLVQVNPEDRSLRTYSLAAFYDQIRSLPHLRGHELNIEACAAGNDRLFLFNRGKNLILEFPLADFMDYLNANHPYPEPSVFEVKLPEIDEIEAGLSGAEWIPEANTIVFTASVENTSNAIDDGEILGSFVGTIDPDAMNEQLQPACIQISENHNPLRIKVESVTVLAAEPGHAEILLVTDSDGGNSEILRADLSWK